jgi:hypothetical protein
MAKSKSFWVAAGVVATCIGCCAAPVYLLFSGVIGVGALASLWRPALLEPLLCLLPILLLGWIYYRHTKRKICCSNPTDECNDQQCNSSVTHKQNN